MNEPQQSDWIEAMPDGSVLFAICESTLQWKEALGELIDNAFDAGATIVKVEFGSVKRKQTAYLSISDDGAGCSDPIAMIRLGAHKRTETTRLGRYGIGLKDSVLWAGGRDSSLRISTTRDGQRSDLSLVWREFAKGWRLPSSALKTSRANPEEHGTCITVEPVRKHVPDGAAWKNLLDELSYIYWPALESGRQIVVRSNVRGRDAVALRPYQWPDFVEELDENITVCGRNAHIRLGIVKEGQANRYRGITYTHEFRVVKTATGNGCGGLDFTNVAGYVELDSSWRLTKNKNDISEYAEELYAAVAERARPLLEKAEQRGQQLQLAALTKDAEQLLNELLLGQPDAKARRNPGVTQGTKEPTGRGRRHRKASEIQDGATFAKERYGALRIRYADVEEPGIGYHETGIVFLSQTHAWVKHLRNDNNAAAIAQLALTLFLEDYRRTEQSGQRKMPWAVEVDFGRAFGAALSRPVALDGMRLHEAAE